MPKTQRLVVLLEPSVAQSLKTMARQTDQHLASVVREALAEYIHHRRAIEKMKKTSKLSRYRIPLGDLKDPERLNVALREKYPK